MEGGTSTGDRIAFEPQVTGRYVARAQALVQLFLRRALCTQPQNDEKLQAKSFNYFGSLIGRKYGVPTGEKAWNFYGVGIVADT
jgi:hypothetical protein